MQSEKPGFSGLLFRSVPVMMAVMPPAIVMAAATVPAVMMAASAMPMAVMAMSVAMLHLNNRVILHSKGCDPQPC